MKIIIYVFTACTCLIHAQCLEAASASRPDEPAVGAGATGGSGARFDELAVGAAVGGKPSVDTTIEADAALLGWMPAGAPLPYKKYFLDKIKAELAKPAGDEVAISPELPIAGRSVRYDRSFHEALRAIAEVYAKSDKAGIKISDWGCGLGTFTLLLPSISDGSKPLQIIAIDGVAKNTAFVKAQYEADKSMVFPGIKFFVGSKLMQNLSSVNCFGKKYDDTFDAITCLNVLHFMSQADGDKTLKHMYDLLKPGGIAILAVNCIALWLGEVPEAAGHYLETSSVFNNGDIEAVAINSLEEKKQFPMPLVDISAQGDYVLAEGKYELISSTAMDERIIMFNAANGIVIRTAEDIVKMRTSKARRKVMDIHKVVERFTLESMRSRAEAAGFAIKHMENYTFNDIGGTDFGRKHMGEGFAGAVGGKEEMSKASAGKDIFFILQKPV